MPRKKEVKAKDEYEDADDFDADNAPLAKPLPKEGNVERAVGDILREEGIIKDVEERDDRPRISGKDGKDEVSVNQVLMEVEKLREVVNTLKSIKFEADERIKELAESLGEVRSLFFQRDASIKEMEGKIEEINETIRDIKPERFQKMIEARDKDVGKVNLNIERISKMTEDLNNRLTKNEKILDKVRSIENIEDLNKETHDTFDKIKELKWAVERDSAKTERFFLEGDKRMKELQNMQVKVDQTEELAKEMLKDLDSAKIKMDSFLTKEEFAKNLKESLTVGAKKEERIAEKAKRKEEIGILIKNLDDQFKKGIISEGAYSEIREKNVIVLNNLEKEIAGVSEERDAANISEWSKFIEDNLENLKINAEINQQKMDLLEASIKTGERGYKKKKESKPQKGEDEHLPEKDNSLEKSLLNKEIKEIEELLKAIDEQYRKGVISPKTYNEIKKKNLRKMEGLRNNLKSKKQNSPPINFKIKKAPEKTDKRKIKNME